MKRLVALVALALVAGPGAWASVVNNSGTSPEDSVAYCFYSLDSLGNPTSADSFFVLVIGPSGDSVFAEDITVASARVDSAVQSGATAYIYRVAVADIDGPGTVGQYAISITAKSNSPLYRTPMLATFQVVGWELDALGDSAAYARKAVDSLGIVLDSLYALLDSVQSQDDWVARQAEVANLDGWGPLVDNDSLIVDVSSLSFPPNFSILDINDSAGVGYIALDLDATHGNLKKGTLEQDALDNVFNNDSSFLQVQAAVNEGLDSLKSQDDWVSAGPSSWSTGDSGAVAGIVWNTPQANHTGAGSFGKFLDAQVSSCSAGSSGLYAVTITVVDTSNAVTVPGVNLVVRDLTQSSLVGLGITDASGEVDFNLDSDSYVIIATAPGYGFESYDTLIVSASVVDTVVGYQFDPGAPGDASLCRVYGFVYSVGGSPETGATVSAWLPRGVVQTDDVIVSPFPVASSTDATGYFYLDLIPSSLLTGSDTRYEISIGRSDGTVLRKRVIVPNVSSWQLTW